MATYRAYTWGVVSYETDLVKIQPLLDSANHWVYALHDKDMQSQDDGTKRLKDPHYHIILTFENEQSSKQIIERVNTDQNLFTEGIKNTIKGSTTQSVRGLYRYLIHDGQNPEEKYIYDASIRVHDDLDYWQHRCKEELDIYAKDESFFEDLTARDGFSVTIMGRKYGRDFMKNMGAYLEYRRAYLSELEWNEAMEKEREREEKWREIEKFCLDNFLEWDEIKNGLYFSAMKARTERERMALFNQIQKLGEEEK